MSRRTNKASVSSNLCFKLEGKKRAEGRKLFENVDSIDAAVKHPHGRVYGGSRKPFEV